MITVLKVEGLSKVYGNKTLFENISFQINEGEKFALIAENGAGKTTLINCIIGKDIPDAGKFQLNKKISMACLEQDPLFNDDVSVMEYVFRSSDKMSDTIKNYELAMLSANANDIQNAVHQMDVMNAWDFEHEIKTVLDVLKMTELTKNVRELSGGQKKRLALAVVILSKPQFMILDEPTNHLDFEMIEWLEDYLSKSNLTVLTVSHDRFFLDKVCNVFLEIDNGNVHKYNGNYTHFERKREERIEAETNAINSARNLLKVEADWMSRSPQARTSKSKYRIENYYKIKEEAEKKVTDRKFELDIEGKRLGKKIIELYDISKSFGDQKLINRFSYMFNTTDRIAVIGKNGVGKSTLLNILSNKLQIDSGRMETGETVSIGYYEQSAVNLPEDKRLLEVISDIADVIKLGKNKEMTASAFANYFMFPHKMQSNYVSQLSGGEKKRLYLLTVLMKNPNVLLLDEPTNDLDMFTLNVLEDYLRQFKGTVMFVSHDRYFIDHVAETLFVFNGDGEIKIYPGNYSQYREYTMRNTVKPESQKKKETGDEKPKQNRTDKLTYKEKIEFEKLEHEIKLLSNEKQALEDYMHSGNYKVEELNIKSARLNELNALLDEKEMRWLELSEKT